MGNRDTPPMSPGLEEDVDNVDVMNFQDSDESSDANYVEEIEEMSEDSEELDDAICTFLGHKGSVFCGSISKDGKLAATGGEDDKAYLWDVSTSDIILECTGHKDSVIFSDFNYDDSYLATCDMLGVLQVWDMRDRRVVMNYEMGDMNWMQWHPAANVLLAGSDQGEIYMWKVPAGDCKIILGSGIPAQSATLLPDGKRLAVGYQDGTMRIADLKSHSVLFTITRSIGHTDSVIAMDSYVDNNLIISAALDGRTIISASQTGKVLAILQNLASQDTSETQDSGDEDMQGVEDYVEAVAFHKNPENQIAVTGTSNGRIFIWDIAKKVIRHKIDIESGITKLIWKYGESIFFSGSTDGNLRCFDGRSGVCLRSFIGNFRSDDRSILDLCIPRSGKKVLTTSDDGVARIFEVNI